MSCCPVQCLNALRDICWRISLWCNVVFLILWNYQINYIMGKWATIYKYKNTWLFEEPWVTSILLEVLLCVALFILHHTESIELFGFKSLRFFITWRQFWFKFWGIKYFRYKIYDALSQKLELRQFWWPFNHFMSL